MSELIEERIIKLFKTLNDEAKDRILAELNVIMYEEDDEFEEFLAENSKDDSE